MTDSRTKILSSPSILATDNRPARIQIGQEEPIATGSTTVQVGTPASTTTIQYRNTGRIVTIIPQVNSQGLVNLQILAEVSAARLLGRTVGQDQYPVFDIRQAETTAVVQDNETLAIGGIIAENAERSRRGIPYLMNLPVLGRFFGSTSDSITRTELIMLITPHVIRGRDESRQVTDDFRSKLSSVRAELERLEREQARLKPKPRPEILPPMPDPNVIQPAPQPTPGSMLPGQGAALPPSGYYFGGSSLPHPGQAGALAPMTGRADEAVGNYPAPEIPREVIAPKPQGFALSLAPVEIKPAVTIAVEKPVARRIVDRQNRIWAVQVAALADSKDAESLAAKLRKVGHQAYVLTTQVAEKIWHRVRIGKFENQNDAQELRKTLTAEKEYRQAYVAAN